MSTIWIGILAAVVCAIALIVLTSWRQRVEMAELGTVSDQWLAEQRTNDRHTSGR